MSGLFILGGSTYYTLLLLQSLERHGLSQRFSRIAIFGRNANRLQLIARAGAELLKGTVPIIATDRIEDCLDPEYDLLFNQMRFGGLQARDQDEKIAIAHGLAADETIGIVGVSNAIRTIVGLKGFIDTLQAKTEPYALLNFTNPCSIVCQYLGDALDARVIGICDYPAHMQHEIAKVLHVPVEAVSLDYFGLNHFGFIHGVKVDGHNMLAEAIAARPPFMPDCNRHFSTLLNISWAFVFEADRIVAQQRDKANRANALLRIEQQCDDLLARGEMRPCAFLDILAQRDCHWYDLAVSPVLSQLTGSEARPVYVNCAAWDAIELGRNDLVVEATCALGAKEASLTPLPEALRSSPEYQLVRMMKQAELTLLSSIVESQPQRVIGACLMNPMIRSLDSVERYFAELYARDAGIRQFWNGAV